MINFENSEGVNHYIGLGYRMRRTNFTMPAEPSISNMRFGLWFFTWYVEINRSNQTRTNEENAVLNRDDCSNNYFEMRLFSDKKEYRTNEKIRLWATLEYIGNKDSIQIWHGGGFMLFYITDGEDFNLEPIITLPLLSTTLERGRVYAFDYYKSGGWGTDDPKADFWEQFFKEQDLFLPQGNYTITLRGAFSLTPTGRDIDLTCKINIIVI